MTLRKSTSTRRALRAVVALLLLAVLLPAAPRAMVQDEDLLAALGDVALFVETEVLVAGATRRVAKLSEAPGTITVIDGEKLEEWGALTLGEALRYVTSVTFAPGTIALTTEFRDIEQQFNNKVLLLVDGRVVNGVFRGNFFLDLAQPIENVARIEIVRGPGSALYGANAFAGFINVVTRRGDQIEGIEYEATVGSHGLRRGSIVTGDTKGRHNWTVEGRWATTGGEDLVNPEQGNADHDDVHVGFHWGKGDSKGESWFANLTYTEVDQGVPGDFGFETPGDRLEEKRFSLDAFKQWEPSSTTKLKLRGYYNRQDNRLAFRRADVDFRLLGDQFVSRTSLRSWDEALVLSIGTLNPDGDPDPCNHCDDVALAAPGGGTIAEFDDLAANGLPQATDRVDSDEWQGFVELQADWRISDSNYLLGGLSARFDDLDNDVVGDRRFENFAFFVEDEQRFLDDELILLGSLRLDDHSFFGLTVSPRVSLIWSPNDKLIMKSAFGKAFRSPNFVELFGETRIGAARIFGAERAVRENLLPETFQRCRDPDLALFECPDELKETLSAELEQEEIQTVELWTELTPTDRLKIILNLYHFEIENEVGIAIDRNDVYYFLEGPEASALAGGPPFPAYFAIPGLRDIPTFGVFLNAPDTTRGWGAELEIHVDPADWVDLQLKYSRRDNTKAEVRRFVEADDAIEQETLVPTFGSREFHADQLIGLVAFRYRDKFWSSLRMRWLSRPGQSFIAGGEGFSSDLTLGWRHQNFTVAGTVFNVNGGGVLFDPTRDDFVESDPDLRLSVAYAQSF